MDSVHRRSRVQEGSLNPDSCNGRSDQGGDIIDRFEISIDNYRYIESCYQKETASIFSQKVFQLVSEKLKRDNIAVDGYFCGKFRISAQGFSSAAIAMRMEGVSSEIAAHAIDCGGVPIHASLSWCVIDAEELAGRASQGVLQSPSEVLQGGVGWAKGYRDDMAVLAGLMSDLARGGVFLGWQPVAHAGSDGRILLQRAMPCRIDMRDGGLVALDVAPALERLGMSHLLDRWAVDQVLDQLQESPEAVLAVAVSGRSIADTRWQRDVVARLRACAGLARRLVLVVVGAGLVPAGDAWSLIAEMRRLGCCLALGGFGSGGASIGDVVALSPDMVEVDSFLVGWAEQSDQWRVVFSSLVNIARALDVPVIVTGVSTEARYAAARAAGGRWLQGDFIGRVRSTRLWSGAMHEFSKVA